MDGLNRIGIGVDIVGINFNILFQNKTLKEKFGDLVGFLCYQKYMGLNKPCEYCPMIKAIENNRIERSKLKGLDGRFYEIISSPLPNPDGSIDRVAEVVLEITDYKKIEQKLRESEKKYRNFVETINDWIWEVDQNSIYTYCSPKVYDLLGYKPEEIIGKSPFDFMPQEEVERIKSYFLDIIKSQKPFERLENINLHKDGRYITLETSGVPIIDNKGILLGFRGIDRDITKGKEIELKLKESEEKFRTIADQSLIGIIIIKNSRILYLNNAESNIAGYSIEEMMKWTKEDILNNIHLMIESKL